MAKNEQRTEFVRKLIRGFCDKPFAGISISTIISVFSTIIFVRILWVFWVLRPMYNEEILMAKSNNVHPLIWLGWMVLYEYTHWYHPLGFQANPGLKFGVLFTTAVSMMLIYLLLKRATEREFREVLVKRRILDWLLFWGTFILLSILLGLIFYCSTITYEMTPLKYYWKY